MVNGIGVAKRIALTEHAHMKVAAVRDPPLVGLGNTRQHRKQRRLAVTVLTHDADTIALGHAQRHVLEDNLGGIFE